MHCTSFVWMLFTEPQQHFTRPPHPHPPALVVPTMGVFVSYVVKFETRASQVPLVCLHVTHSSVIETLLMHRSFKMEKCFKKKKKEKENQ